MDESRKLVKAEEHHRRPRNIGGQDTDSNISLVNPRQHRSWHTLFGSMNALQITDKINSFAFKPEKIKVICEFINGSEVEKKGHGDTKNGKKITDAWDRLFGGKEWHEIIAFINNVWLDPSYHLRIVKAKAE